MYSSYYSSFVLFCLVKNADSILITQEKQTRKLENMIA